MVNKVVYIKLYTNMQIKLVLPAARCRPPSNFQQ